VRILPTKRYSVRFIDGTIDEVIELKAWFDAVSDKVIHVGYSPQIETIAVRFSE
jgi:hypothetical protein